MSLRKPLTTRQKELLFFIKKFLNEKDHSPSLDELRQFLRVGSINTAVQHLYALEKKGYILRRKHAKRGIEVRGSNPALSSTWTISIPVCASVGCDDLSVFSNAIYDEFIEVDKNIIGEKEKVVAVRAVGDSMNDADIHNGDYILIELTSQTKHGDRVAAVLGDMVTVKKLEKRNGVIVLRPESKDPKYKPIILSENFKIAGKVICAIPGESLDMTDVVYSSQ